MPKNQPVRRSAGTAGAFAVSLLLLTARPPDVAAQFIQPEDRALYTDFSYVTAVAATPAVVYAATPLALVIYDRATLRWRETVGLQDGFPPGGITAMAANPNDDSVWLVGAGQWFLFRPFGRTWDSGPLPGRAGGVVLDRDDPARGAWFQTTAGWVMIDRGGFASSAPPPAARLGPLSPADLRRLAPAYESALMSVTRDAQLRRFDLTAAAAAPMGEAIYLATDGNGAFRVDPVSYTTDRLPAGLLAPGAGSVALIGRRVCAGTDYTAGFPAVVRSRAARRGVTCVRDDFSDQDAWEAEPGAAAVGARVRALAPAAHGAVWAGSEQGLARLGPGRPARLTTAQGLPSFDVRALAADSGGVWAGTSHGLAFVRDGERPEVADAVSFGAAVGALLVHDDTLWIGTSLGLLALPRGAAEPVVVPGGPALRLPVVDLALLHDTLVVATESRVLWRAGGAWSDAGAAPAGIGRIAALAAGEGGLWLGGDAGIAFLAARGGTWIAFTSARDVPQPVRDIAVDDRYVWLATPAGLVRLERRALAR